MANSKPLDTSRRGLQRLYCRIVLLAVSAVLGLQMLTSVVFGEGLGFEPFSFALYSATLLFAWFAHSMIGDSDEREPTGFVLGVTGILLIVLCIETGGLASAYYMLVFATCVFGALVMKPAKAFLLTALLAAIYCGLTWLYPAEGGLLQGNIRGFMDALQRIDPPDQQSTSALVVHCGFLFVGTWIAMRLTSGFRERVVSLEDHAIRDPLTGLPNRRGFMEKLHEQTSRAVHWDWPIAILVLDLDHFKRVNDTFGHPVGDQVLAAAAKLIRDAAGPLDNLGRIGGEEFAIAAVGADRSQASDLGDRVVRSFRNHAWENMHEGLRVTCSVGVSVVQPSRAEKPVLEDLSALIDDADRALLQVKSRGRDGYLLAEDMVNRPPARVPHAR